MSQVGWKYEKVVGIGLFAKNGRLLHNPREGGDWPPLLAESDVRVGDTYLTLGPTGRFEIKPEDLEDFERQRARYGEDWAERNEAWMMAALEYEVWDYIEGLVVVGKQVRTGHTTSPRTTCLWLEGLGWAHPIMFDNDDRRAWTTLMMYR